MDLKLTESPSFSSDKNFKISTNESSDTGSEVSPIKQKICKYCDAVFKVSNSFSFEFLYFEPFLVKYGLEKTRKNSYWRKTLQMQHLRKGKVSTKSIITYDSQLMIWNLS